MDPISVVLDWLCDDSLGSADRQDLARMYNAWIDRGGFAVVVSFNEHPAGIRGDLTVSTLGETNLVAGSAVHSRRSLRRAAVLSVHA